MKIYCKNCVHFQLHYSDDATPSCMFLTSDLLRRVEYIRDHRGINIKNDVKQRKLLDHFLLFGTYDVHCSLNKEYRCPIFKCKWWKFWIFPKRGPRHILVELLKEDK